MNKNSRTFKIIFSVIVFIVVFLIAYFTKCYLGIDIYRHGGLSWLPVFHQLAAIARDIR